MKQYASLALGAALLFGVSVKLRAADYDAEFRDRDYHEFRAMEETTRYLESLRHGSPVAYYPTQRYFSKEGTIVYNFVPLDQSGLHKVSLAEAVLLSPDQIAHTGGSARVLLHQRRLVFRETKKVGPLSTQGPISPETTAPVRPTPPDTVVPAAPAPADATAQPASSAPPVPPAPPAPVPVPVPAK